MDKIDIKALIKKVESIDVDQKIIERKSFEDYLLDKQIKGKFQDNIISFEEAEDFVYFKKICEKLGFDIADIMTFAR